MRNATTVEQTGKTWKLWTAIGVLLGVGGLVVALTSGSGFGWLASLAGGLLWAYARIGAWWNHG